jgi:hypothetical protein
MNERFVIFPVMAEDGTLRNLRREKFVLYPHTLNPKCQIEQGSQGFEDSRDPNLGHIKKS